MGKKILTIDDSKTLRIIVAKHLAPFGVQTLEAENGQQGVVRAREGVPDVILLDYNMPVMDGYHTLAELKTDPALKAIPVVMLTTETVEETVIKLIKLGLKDYIAKPFTREVFLQKLNPILSLYDGKEVPPAPPPAVAKPPAPAVDQKEKAAPKIVYLTKNEDVRILDCPGPNSPKFSTFASALESNVREEIDAMAKEGLKQLIIVISDGLLSDSAIAQKFTDFVEHARKLSLTIRFVAESLQLQDALKRSAEIASIPADTSLECALKSMRQEPVQESCASAKPEA